MLQADTELEIRRSRRIGDRINDVEVNLEQGRVENDITPDPTGQPHYRIRNDIAVTAVRGTAFRVGLLEGERLQTEVLRGSVSVANDSGTSLLKQGNGVVTEAGQAPGQPIRLLEAPDLSTLAPRQRYLPMELEWKGLTGAVAYRVQIAATEAFEELLYDRVRKSNRASVANLPDGRYFLRVRGIDANALEGFDSTAPLEVAARPVAPFAQAPADSARLRAGQVAFR
ncbi:MAG: hypothetical protein B0D88_08710 [Candidatus Sedimenticola endophacoides]|nr:MAG: hypothetical protein B0D88_08710 [Candidatus Sedimenticola endophacoides]OQX42956.1 MAG: hypothetical protein B0D89_00255 [Candidatus Sedimenticola endophacoides]